MISNSLLDVIGAQLEERVQAKYSTVDEYKVLPLDSIFEEVPVSLETFLYDSNYLDHPRLSQKQFDFVDIGTQIYYKETLEQLGWKVYDPYINVLVGKWGKGSGKDTVARLILIRIVYLLMCLKSPQRYLGMPSYDSINMINIAYSAKQANVIFFEPLKRMVATSPKFKEWGFNAKEEVLEFPKHINLHSGHSEQESMEGHNLIAAVLDEIAAFKTNLELAKRQRRSVRPLQHSAEAIFDVFYTSATSRFSTIFKLVLISYTRFQGDFIMQKADEARRNERWFVSEGATWDVNPTKKREMFDEDYKRNPEKAKAVYECKPPKAIDAYFKNLSEELIRILFPVKDEPVDDCNILQPWFKGRAGCLYFAHIDLALSGDRAGLCVVHRSGFVERQIEFQDSNTGKIGYTCVREPTIVVDLWTSFEAEPGKEIDLEQVRLVIMNMHEKRNFKFGKVTYDGFQSADSIQLLIKAGIESERLSVDRDTKAYDTTKSVMYGKRLRGYFREIGVEELLNLAIVTGNKIDHQMGGSKDEADALAGSVYNAVECMIGDAQESDFSSTAPYADAMPAYDNSLVPSVWRQY